MSRTELGPQNLPQSSIKADFSPNLMISFLGLLLLVYKRELQSTAASWGNNDVTLFNHRVCRSNLLLGALVHLEEFGPKIV